MNKADIILVVVSVLGTAIAFALPLVSMLWRVFGLVAEIRLQLAEIRNQVLILSNQSEHLDDRWESVTAQTNQKFDHFSNRLRGEVAQMQTEVRELQNYLSKTTSFEVRK